MKKRSLFAAIAMLIVSAIVLTSATYAWFTSNAQSSVAKVTADVTRSDGSLLVSADNETWVTKLLATDLIAKEESAELDDDANALLYPVDCIPSATPTFYSCAFADGTYTAGSDATGKYLAYTWYVKTTSAVEGKVINVPIAFTAGDSAASFIYGLVVTDQGDTPTFGSGTYYAFNGADVVATEDDDLTPCIVDADEVTEGSIADTATAPSPLNVVQVPADGDSHAITVFVWAEGQDANCNDSAASINDAGFTFNNITLVAAA